MSNNHNISASSLVVLMLVALNLISVSQVDCKPFELFRQHHSKTIIKSPHDLIALANEQATAEAPVQYITVEQEQPQVVAQQAAVVQEPTATRQENQQEVVYYMLPDGQTIEASQYIAQQQQQAQQQAQNHEQHQHQTGKPCDHEQRSTETAAQQAAEIANGSGYPGEIVYTNQEGQLLRQMEDGSYEQIADPNQAKTQENLSVVDRPSVELVTRTGKSLRESARDLTATILTEIPINDISKEVLDQLKKDYGAKVVATREYPGANLVINCAEHSGLDVSLCSNNKQPPITSYEPSYEQNEPSLPYVVEEQPAHMGQVAPGEALGLTSGPETGARLEAEAEAEIESAERNHEPDHESEKVVRQPDTRQHVENNNNHQQNDEAHHYEYEPAQPTHENQEHNHQDQQQQHHQEQHQPQHHQEHPVHQEQQHHQEQQYQQQQHQQQQQEQPQHSTYEPTSTTPTAYETSTGSEEQSGETTGEQAVPTSAYNVEVTSSSTNHEQKTIAPRNHASKNEQGKNQASSDIRQQADDLSSISQQEEKIEK